MKTTLLMGMIVLLLPTALARAAAPVRRSQNAGLPFGMLPLVDEINCADTAAAADSHLFTEVPKGASRVETLLGRRCRVLPNVGGSRYFAYRIGKNKNLKAGRAYVLSVEFPEDRPRSLFVLNRGAEMAHGFHTGAALGDALYTYTNNNAESLKIPLSGRFRTWKTLFYLHDRFPDLNLPRGSGPRPLMPADGFWVVIAQAQSASDPISEGAAVSRIRLFEVPNPEVYRVKLRLPPRELPQRHLFWREEMSDGVVGSRKEEERGVLKDMDWYEYKARLMQFLGMNTFSKDLLEFGHNQGWDSGETNDWYNSSSTPRRWEGILGIAAKYGLNVLPYYEYAGSIGQKAWACRSAARRCRARRIIRTSPGVRRPTPT